MSEVMERLRTRKRPMVGYPVRVAELEETQAAEAAVAATKKYVDRLQLQAEPDKAQVRAAKKELEKAEKGRDACYVKIPLRAMPPKIFEDLQDEYPEAEGDDKKAARDADEGYLTAVFLASVDSDDTEDQWRAFLEENVSQGERMDLFDVALGINGRARALNGNIPKG